ncbi:MAG TPA: hypothetical protein VKB38_05410 [Terracidiphilus sp.]|nr:hypothetical protein [Terracidiphilus sp.]
MAKWHCADLSNSVEHPPAFPAAGNPIAYGLPDCSQSGEFDTSGCPIRVPRVVYRGTDSNIYELALVDEKWQWNNLLSVSAKWGQPPAASSDPTAFVGTFNDQAVAMLVYTALSTDVYQLMGPDGWIASDLSTTTPPAAPAQGRPFGYSTGDGDCRAVYLGPDGSIFELLSQQQGPWVCNNLSTNYKAGPKAPAAGGNPFAYVTNVPRVIYRGTDGHIFELSPRTYWEWADLTDISGGAPAAVTFPYPATGDPNAYVTNDGIARVVYAAADGDVIELRLEGGGWKWASLLTANRTTQDVQLAAGNPFGYVAPDSVPRVVYTGHDGNIYELTPEPPLPPASWQHRAPSWQLNNLSKLSGGAPAAVGDPFGYWIFDNIPRVVYRGTNNKIYELSLW